jgi:hypothetical protein
MDGSFLAVSCQLSAVSFGEAESENRLIEGLELKADS